MYAAPSRETILPVDPAQKGCCKCSKCTCACFILLLLLLGGTITALVRVCVIFNKKNKTLRNEKNEALNKNAELASIVHEMSCYNQFDILLQGGSHRILDLVTIPGYGYSALVYSYGVAHQYVINEKEQSKTWIAGYDSKGSHAVLLASRDGEEIVAAVLANANTSEDDKSFLNVTVTSVKTGAILRTLALENVRPHKLVELGPHEYLMVYGELNETGETEELYVCMVNPEGKLAWNRSIGQHLYYDPIFAASGEKLACAAVACVLYKQMTSQYWFFNAKGMTAVSALTHAMAMPLVENPKSGNFFTAIFDETNPDQSKTKIVQLLEFDPLTGARSVLMVTNVPIETLRLKFTGSNYVTRVKDDIYVATVTGEVGVYSGKSVGIVYNRTSQSILNRFSFLSNDGRQPLKVLPTSRNTLLYVNNYATLEMNMETGVSKYQAYSNEWTEGWVFPTSTELGNLYFGTLSHKGNYHYSYCGSRIVYKWEKVGSVEKCGLWTPEP